MLKLWYIRHIQNVHANEDQYIDVNRIRTKRTNLWFSQWRKALFSNAFSLCITQIGRSDLCTGGRANRNDIPTCERFGETINQSGYGNPFPEVGKLGKANN